MKKMPFLLCFLFPLMLKAQKDGDVWEVVLVSITEDNSEIVRKGANLFIDYAQKEFGYLEEVHPKDSITVHIIKGDRVCADIINPLLSKLKNKQRPIGEERKHILIVWFFVHGFAVPLTWDIDYPYPKKQDTSVWNCSFERYIDWYYYIVGGNHSFGSFLRNSSSDARGGFPYLILLPNQSETIPSPEDVLNFEHTFGEFKEAEYIIGRKKLYDHVIFIAEACNDTMATKIAIPRPLPPSRAKLYPYKNKIKDIVCSVSAAICASASYGQKSAVYSDIGGIFSFACMQAWETISATKMESPDFYTFMYLIRSHMDYSQTPMFYIEK